MPAAERGEKQKHCRKTTFDILCDKFFKTARSSTAGVVLEMIFLIFHLFLRFCHSRILQKIVVTDNTYVESFIGLSIAEIYADSAKMCQ